MSTKLILIASLVLSACGASTATTPAPQKPEAASCEAPPPPPPKPTFDLGSCSK